MTEPTLQAIAQSLDTLRREMTGSIDGLRQEMTESFEVVNETVSALATHMDERFSTVDAKIDRVRAEMATKDFVDRRVADVETRLEGKIGTLVGVLEQKEVITPREAKKIITA